MDYEKVLNALADYDGRGHGEYFNPLTNAFCAVGWLAHKAGWLADGRSSEERPIGWYLSIGGPYDATEEEIDRLVAANDNEYEFVPVTPEERARRVRSCVQEMRDMVAAPVSLAEALCSI